MTPKINIRGYNVTYRVEMTFDIDGVDQAPFTVIRDKPVLPNSAIHLTAIDDADIKEIEVIEMLIEEIMDPAPRVPKRFRYARK